MSEYNPFIDNACVKSTSPEATVYSTQRNNYVE